MSLMFTPPRSSITFALLLAVILASPFVVAAHFGIRDWRGDYGTTDAIMIPIASYVILAFPFALLFLVAGLRRYSAGSFLLVWRRHRFWRSLVWTALLFEPVIWAAQMILDGIYGRLYWVTAFFVVYLYCLLVLRASVVAREPNAI